MGHVEGMFGSLPPLRGIGLFFGRSYSALPFDGSNSCYEILLPLKISNTEYKLPKIIFYQLEFVRIWPDLIKSSVKYG